MSTKGSFAKKLFLIIYFTMWTALIVAGFTWLAIYLIGTLGYDIKINGFQPANDEVFDSVLALTDKKVERYIGEWEFLEPKLPGHFHHIGRWYQSDKLNFCIDCHGPIPHSRSLQERAFLNMHNLFISCQVCHVQEAEGVAADNFGWVDINTGDYCENPDIIEGVWGEYGAKIVPLKNNTDKPQPLSLSEEQQFATEFRQRINNLNDSQKVIGNKFIHRKCVEEPVKCSDCHNVEKQFLPYTSLGYSQDRADFLVSSEVVDLVKRYETFYMPNLLKPQKPVQKQGTQKEQP